MMLRRVFFVLTLCSFIASTLTCRVVDVQTISNVLSGVKNWEELAGWLDLDDDAIQAKCQPKLNGVKHNCYRSTLVRQYCEKWGSREEVVEKIAQVLEEKMNNKLKAQQLRKLTFDEDRTRGGGRTSAGESSNSEETKSPPPETSNQEGSTFLIRVIVSAIGIVADYWVGLSVGVVLGVATVFYSVYWCRRRDTRLTLRQEITDSKKTLEIVSGESLSYRWKGFGLKLEAPSNALDCGVPSQTLNLLNCNIDHFKVPENMELVSGIYLVEFKGEFAHPITIGIQHCASVGQLSQFSSLSFVSMKPPTQEAMVYQLQSFSGGVFPQDSCYGSIHLSQSSIMAVVTRVSATKSYIALNYYIPKTTTTWHMDLIFIYDLEISIESVNKCCPKEASDISELKVTFTGEEMSLDIPESGIFLESGWNIKPLHIKFQKNSVGSVQLSSRHIPSCRLQLQYTGKDLQPPSFSYELKITGVSIPCISIGILPYKYISCSVRKELSKMDQQKLESQLSKESKDLQKQFSSLVGQIQDYLQHLPENITRDMCEKLKICLMCMTNIQVAFKENSQLNELKSAKTISDILMILLHQKLVSFLHYYLIENIITSCCEESSEIKVMLEEYNIAFDDYIKRRVCETSLYYDGQFKVFTGSDSEESVNLLIITDESWNELTEFVKVTNLRPIIAGAFRCNEIFLALQSIKPQCLKLCYALISSLVDHIFPLTLEEWNKLRSLGIAEIHCRDYHYMVDEKSVTGKGFVNVFIDQEYLSKDYFVAFGMCLGKDKAELGKVWNKVLGRYDTAILNLVIDMIQESQNPEEKLFNALREMNSTESASRTSKAIHKAVLSKECLAILLEDTPNHFGLGQQLGMDNGLLEALFSHFKNNPQLFVKHMIGMWQMKDPEDVVNQLSEALVTVEDTNTAIKLQLLAHLENQLTKPWKGHELNLSSMEAVICKVKDVKRFARQINMPEDQIVDIISGPTGDIYGRISSYCLEAQLSWTQIKKHLIMSNEFEAIEITEILEQYNRQDVPLTAEHLLDVLKNVNDRKGFFEYLCVEPRPSLLDTITFFIKQSNVEVTWKKVALALYHKNEEKAMDRLFHYMKSPTEPILNMKTIEPCFEEEDNMSSKLDVQLKVPERKTNEDYFPLLGVKLWILTESSASWQSFVMSLYSAELDTALQKAKAKKLLTPKDEQFTLPNIMKMIQNVKDWEVLGLLVGIRSPKSKFNEIRITHKEFEAQREAMIKLWYETHPFASWSLLHQALNMMGETETAQAVQKEFLKGTERDAHLSVMQCVFTGPPRTGKSSLWKRLLGIMPDKLLPSTGITDTEGTIRLNIRSSCGFTVHVSEVGWKELKAEEEMTGFLALVTQEEGTLLQPTILRQPVAAMSHVLEFPTNESIPIAAEVPSNADTSTVDKDTSDVQLQQECTTQNNDTNVSSLPDSEKHTHAIRVYDGDLLPSPSQVLKQALIMLKQVEVTKSIDNASFVYFTDTGGQPEFQELLPLLMSACNTVFIIFNLENDLGSKPPLEYLPSLDEAAVCYDSPYTVGEMLCQSLESVPIMASDEDGQDVFLEESNAVLFIGTHKDMVSSQKILETNDFLIDLIKNTPQYKARVVKFSSAGNIIFAVNNFSSIENDEDFAPIRTLTESLIYGDRSFKIKAPTSRLFLGIVLQKVSESQPIIALEQCKELARQCGISKNEIEMALTFLHRKIGAIRHYNTENLNNVVILKPQLIINLLSNLMKRNFQKSSDKRAIFTSQDIVEVVKESEHVREEFLLCLTRDLLLSAPHPDTTVQDPKHFLTCMLPVSKQDQHDKTSLLFTLKSISLPSGSGRAALTAIMQQATHFTSTWKINYERLFRNSLELSVSPSNTTFTVKHTRRCLSITISTPLQPNVIGPSFQVRKRIETILKEVLKLYNYGMATVPVTAFICPDHNDDNITSSSHYAILTPEGYLKCLATQKISELPQYLHHWIKLDYGRELYLSCDEDMVVTPLSLVQKVFDVQLGSYPDTTPGNSHHVKLTVESVCKKKVDEAYTMLALQFPLDIMMSSQYKCSNSADKQSVEVRSKVSWLLQHLTPAKASLLPDSLCAKVAATFSVMEETYKRYSFDEVFVSFNGGKDCTIIVYLLHALLKRRGHDFSSYKIPALFTSITGNKYSPEVESFVNEATEQYSLHLFEESGPSSKDTLRQFQDHHPAFKAVMMGIKRTDPYYGNMTTFAPTDVDKGWPEYMRVNAIPDWSYWDVWLFIRIMGIPYCCLYDQGYTSLDGVKSMCRNPHLAVTHDTMVGHHWLLKAGSYLPAYMLVSEDHE